jgi:uncharacterized OB-fold protein
MVVATRCQECDTSRFPPAVVCICGSQNLADEPIRSGTVEAITVVAATSARTLVTVLAAGGDRLVAGMTGHVAVGDAVTIEEHDDRICAFLHQTDER